MLATDYFDVNFEILATEFSQWKAANMIILSATSCCCQQLKTKVTNKKLSPTSQWWLVFRLAQGWLKDKGFWRLEWVCHQNISSTTFVTSDNLIVVKTNVDEFKKNFLFNWIWRHVISTGSWRNHRRYFAALDYDPRLSNTSRLNDEKHMSDMTEHIYRPYYMAYIIYLWLPWYGSNRFTFFLRSLVLVICYFWQSDVSRALIKPPIHKTCRK